jgi:uncharacterized protein (TIRG00374 family)
MPNKKKNLIKANWPKILVGFIFLVFALAIMFRFAEFGQIMDLLKKVNCWWLLAAFAFQLGDYAMVARFYKTIERKISYWHLYKTVIAMAFVDNMLPSFAVGSNTLLHYSARKKGSAQGKASLMVTLNIFLNFLLYSTIFFGGILYLTLSKKMAGFEWVWIPVFLLMATLIILFSIIWTHSGRLHFRSVVSRMLRKWPNIRKKAIAALADLHFFREKIKKREIFISLLFIMFSYILRMAVIIPVFLAFNYAINPGIIITGYLISSFIATISYIRIGFQEAAMTVSYSKLGVPYNLALTATLLYRLVSFWVIMLLGFFAFKSIMREKKKK